MLHNVPKSKPDCLQSSATNDVAPQPIDPNKLAAAMTAALRILRPGSNAQAKVSKRGDAK